MNENQQRLADNSVNLLFQHLGSRAAEFHDVLAGLTDVHLQGGAVAGDCHAPAQVEPQHQPSQAQSSSFKEPGGGVKGVCEAVDKIS